MFVLAVIPTPFHFQSDIRPTIIMPVFTLSVVLALMLLSQLDFTCPK